MATSKPLVGALGALALAVAGGTGWVLLSPAKDAGSAAAPAAAPESPKAGREFSADGGPGTGAVAAPGPAKGPLEVDPGDERDLHGPEGGYSAEEILAAAAKGEWMEVERMLAAGGSDDPRVRDAVLRGLADDRFRFKIADLVKYLKDPQVATLLLEAVRTEGNDYTRSAALRALAQVGGPGAVEAAADVLREAKPGSLLANNAALALGTLGTPEAARILVEGLRAAASGPGSAALREGLSRIRAPETLAALGEMLLDEAAPAAFRAALADALGRTRDPAVVNDLLKAVRDAGDEDLRHSCYRALAMVGSPEAARELLQVVQGAENDRRIEAARALAESTSRAVGPQIEEALRTPLDPVIRSYLVTALGRTGGPSSVEVLGKIVLEGTEEVGLRGAAARSLGQIGDGGASPVLVEALEKAPPGKEGQPLRSRFLEALNETARPEELPRIQRLREAAPEQTPDWFVLTQLVERLKRPQGAGK